ncbi:MAG: hemerythrin domain-containing protein [Phycisphaeraceae bacterium]|nr:hemerythrin domain-containing protein [Phycisphaeraceae bacterium]MCW5762887.1 hemerythrin domain-containing protein [Phycisphaeraceae bacterium]
MPDFVNAPLRRHEALVPFSRDHFTGLVHAYRLIRSATQDRATRRKALAGILDDWNGEIEQHFEDEERLLIPVLDLDDASRLVLEHRELVALFDRIRAQRSVLDPDPEPLKTMGHALDAHIRWEERDLFNRVQNSLTPAQLGLLAVETVRIEATRPRNNPASPPPPLGRRP